MPLREFFHLMQIVDDFDSAEERYRALLGMEVYGPKHWSDFDKRWASLANVGREFVLELMEPSKDPADGASPLPKFWQRHGQHFHSFSWYYDNDEMPEFIERLRAAGIRVIDPYPDDDPAVVRPKTIFTHPKDTFGQMEFQGIIPAGPEEEPSHFRKALHLDPDWTGEWWRDEFALGLLGFSHLTTMVDDLDRAKHFYTELLDGAVFHEETTSDRQSAFVVLGTAVPGREIVVELALPTDADSRLGRDHAGHGNMPHSVSLKVKDVDAAAEHAESAGFSIVERDDDTFLIDPSQLANGPVYCTSRSLPGEPRAWIAG